MLRRFAATWAPPASLPLKAGAAGRSRSLSLTELPSDTVVAGPPPAQTRRAELKSELLLAAAACNRGFGATRADRERIASLFSDLKQLSPTPIATAGIEGGDEAGGTCPLSGCWRLIYTTASDVLSLDASPAAGVGAVYQLIEPPHAVTNIIDLYPRIATLLPVGTLTSALRLRVMTRAAARSASRVGLTFFAARAEPRALFGVDVSSLLPPVGGPLPRLPGAIGTDPATSTSPSFFDVRTRGAPNQRPILRCVAGRMRDEPCSP
jgi:hypothetical protein